MVAAIAKTRILGHLHGQILKTFFEGKQFQNCIVLKYKACDYVF